MTPADRARLRAAAEAALPGGRTRPGDPLHSYRIAFLETASPTAVISLIDDLNAAEELLRTRALDRMVESAVDVLAPRVEIESKAKDARIATLEALLREASRDGMDTDLRQRIDTALSGAEEKEACLSGCHPEEGLSE